MRRPLVFLCLLTALVAAQKAPLKTRLLNGDVCTGTFIGVLSGGPAVQFLAGQGLDFFILDTEHYIFGDTEIRDMILAGRQAGIAPLIRVGEPSQAVTRWLDAGAEGIVVPTVVSPEQAAGLVRFGRYPPEGDRGASLLNGHSGFAPLADPAAFVASRNRDVLLLVMIESPQGVSRLDEILAVPGIDGAIVGTGDYALSIGVPGQADHPRVWDAASTVVARCLAKHKLVSVPVRRPEHAARWLGAGVRMITFVDGNLLGNGCASFLETVRRPARKNVE